MGESLGDLIATLGWIDDDEIDWQNVRQTTVLIQQSFAYEYPGPIASLRHRLMVVPPDYHDDQRLVTHKLRVSGCDIDTERSYDTSGNVVLDPSIEKVEREVEITTWAVVERETAVNGADTPDAITFDQRFAEPSRLTRPDDRLRAVAAELRETGAGGVELAELIEARVRALRLGHGVTAVTTTAAEAWEAGIGVCQDYAHCMLALFGFARCLPGTSRATCSATEAPTRGSRCSSSILRTPTPCGRCRSTRPTTVAPASVTSLSPSGATTATCRRPRGRSRHRTRACDDA